MLFTEAVSWHLLPKYLSYCLAAQLSLWFATDGLSCSKRISWVYFAATMDAAIWGAELAAGSNSERIYVVEPTGPIEDDPNLTDKEVPRQSDLLLSFPRTTFNHCRSDGGGKAIHPSRCST